MLIKCVCKECNLTKKSIEYYEKKVLYAQKSVKIITEIIMRKI